MIASTNKYQIFFRTLLLPLGFGLTLASSISVAQDAFEKGKTYYEHRDEGAEDFQADSAHIDRAIYWFQEALQQDLRTEETTTYLLKAYYFKGMFTGLNKDRQQVVYEKGRTLGEEMMEQFPHSVPIKFWYAANIGRWADVHSFARAATSGVSKKLRRISKDIITAAPQYQGGGGYRVLAQVHFYSPNIPIVMSWPSKEKALQLIKKALQIAPEHPTNRLLYGQILLEFERYHEAKKQLQQLIEMSPRATHRIEDRYIKHRSRQLLEGHF